MMRRNVAVATALLFALTTVGNAQTPAAKLAAAIERELKVARVPGASYALLVDQQLTVGSFGVADLENGAPMGGNTLFQVGSLNKLLTALALSSTLQQMNIPIAARLGDHVPGLTPRLAAVTFDQLLSQTSGLRDQPGSAGATDETALAARVRAISDPDFILPAGTVFSYSNLGYATAGFALEYLRKQPYADALRAAVLAPLGMRESTMRIEASTRAKAVGHRLDEQDVVSIRELDNDTRLWPAGYLWTTAAEWGGILATLARRSSNVYGLAPAFAVATTPRAPMPNVFVGGHYGYGLMLADDRGVRIYEHGGTQRGFSSILRVAPDRNLALVIMTNLDGAPLRRIAQTVMAEALGLPPTAPLVLNETSVSADEMKGFLGVYRNRGAAELAVREGSVVLSIDGGPPMAVSRIGEHRYLARPTPGAAGPEFVLQPATAASPAYLHFALWAYSK